ncbi:MAG: helix-turn-helix transcriptional regulator [Pseudobutyrivibrio ruminis]|nr:helix-turn-helix transcriptional regulator [Pseudobutyrivibrio ruminis]
MELMEDEKIRVSNNIKYLLKEKKKTRKQVANELGYKYTTFCDWVNGNSAPSYSVLEQLGDYFNVEPWQFYGNLPESKVGRAKALIAYANAAVDAKLLDMNTLDTLDDVQIKSLLESGFRFRHKSIEEYEGTNTEITSSIDGELDSNIELSIKNNQLFISNGNTCVPISLGKVIQIMDVMQAILDENS